MDFDLLIFDLDGVLVDTSFCHGLAFNDLWELLGVNGPPYEEIAGRKTGDVVEEFTAELKPNPERVKEWVSFKQQRAREYLASAEIAFNDSEECVRLLTERGQRIALGTGASRETAVMVLQRFGWESVFSTIVTGEDVACGKPAPEIYLKAMERLNVSPERTLIVEDSHSGLAAAVESRAYSASVRSGMRVEDERFVGEFPDIRTMMSELEGVRR
ncbi:MAG: HAD family hydrolase [Blastocatellia bacterium]